MTQLHDKAVIVTGAASGIGRAVALEFARQGALVLLADIDREGLEETRAAVVAFGVEVIARKVDVSDDGDVRDLVAAAVERWGRLDVLSHNAGIDQPVQPALDLDEAMLWRLLRVNTAGTFWCDTHAARAMLTGSGGSIVNTVSDLGYVVVPGLAAYCASKGASLQLTRTFATEWAPKVRVNAVCPTMVDTPMGRRSMGSRPDPAEYLAEITSEIPMKRIAQAEDVVGAIAFLASDASAYVTGIVLPVDGGRTVT